MAKLIRCKTCNAEIISSTKICPNCGAKNKQPIYTKWWAWTIAVVVVLAIATSGNNNSNTNPNTNPNTNSSTNSSTNANTGANTNTGANANTPPASSNAQQPAQAPKSNKLTLEKYNKIQTGMTYKEVIGIIGFEVAPEVEMGEAGSEFYTVSFRYMGSDQVSGSLGANASFMYQNGKLTMKSQIGLK
ncbi:MAG: hypothetical protein Q8865_05165 [Bacillota bacterium]|nr:hypothetical protein [Bacillota bacterium]